ncbi:putative TOR signaling pathway regulator [Piromyces finnis]|uniref:Putative TOR signaling pathway regulator n=1 Tax=Piromyces finnis TaxID=1754191 RepID=A0A1Y1VFE6_9FUNG|nr:putative TOR signaling pathway regulator [Piromyces finnis]|eukprot:ORX54290.1 putative TOR signaling pathway regulator [Piromyces finnis]
MTDNNLTLKEEFEVGQKLYNDIINSTLSSNDENFQKQVNDAIRHFTRASILVQQLSIFSINETVDDINTSDLKFLLIKVYLGELYLKIVNPNSDREKILETAKSHLNEYLSNCELYELFSQNDKEYLEAKLTNKTFNASRNREEKIARYKREKETKNKIEELTKQIQIASERGEENVDEEITRNLILTNIDLFIQQTIQDLEMIKDEMEMVKMMKQMREKQGPNSERVDNSANNFAPIPTSGPLLSQKGKPLRPFVIVDQKERLNQVFRPSHNLPTMTIDEFLENERKRGNILSGGTEPKKKIIDDNDEDALDAETLKQRKWDDFKDDNPKGWGNRMNKG